jgi:large conductance mechanosensitive channel
VAGVAPFVQNRARTVPRRRRRTWRLRQPPAEAPASIGSSWGTEFKAFLLRGNVIDLAVGIVIGAAFGALVTALVADFFTPLIGAIFGTHDFSGLKFGINKSTFLYGDFINKTLAFVAIAAAVFFFVVKPVNYLVKRARRGEEPAEETPPDIALLTEIRDLLRDRARA